MQLADAVVERIGGINVSGGITATLKGYVELTARVVIRPLVSTLQIGPSEWIGNEQIAGRILHCVGRSKQGEIGRRTAEGT